MSMYLTKVYFNDRKDKRANIHKINAFKHFFTFGTHKSVLVLRTQFLWCACIDLQNATLHSTERLFIELFLWYSVLFCPNFTGKYYRNDEKKGWKIVRPTKKLCYDQKTLSYGRFYRCLLFFYCTGMSTMNSCTNKTLFSIHCGIKMNTVMVFHKYWENFKNQDILWSQQKTYQKSFLVVTYGHFVMSK